MAGWQSKRRGGRSSPGRVLLVLALLPALLFGPALGGAVAWIHSHGHSGGHVHLLPDEHDHDVAALEAWHDAQHQRGHGRGGDEEGPAPKGLVIELPELVAASPRGSTVIPAPSALALVLPFLPRWHLGVLEFSSAPGLIRSGWPPQGTKRSGVAALLCSSHAILI